jgi:hypothetical protein
MKRVSIKDMIEQKLIKAQFGDPDTLFPVTPLLDDSMFGNGDLVNFISKYTWGGKVEWHVQFHKDESHGTDSGGACEYSYEDQTFAVAQYKQPDGSTTTQKWVEH